MKLPFKILPFCFSIFVQYLIGQNSIVINEINYHSSDNNNAEDWVEFFNNSSENINITNWEFRDEIDDHIFEFPQNTIIYAQNYLVLCKHDSSFNAVYPNVSNYLPNMGFGLSGGGEPIRLFNSDGVLVDSVNYDDEPPWTNIPDGNGPTLELLNPYMDNLIPENWAASEGFGTPGEQNSVYLKIDSPITTINSFEILGNFPNPFNPITSINYTINKNGFIKIDIFDVKGNYLENLLQQFQYQGNYKINFHSNYPSGQYYAKFQLNQHTKIHKMTLIK